LNDGVIDLVATDHAYPKEAKEIGGIWKAYMSTIGLQAKSHFNSEVRVNLVGYE